jgi:predicted transcriptional regulator
MSLIALGTADPDDIRDALEELSALTGQSAETITEEALRDYLAWRLLQEADLRTAVEQADRGEFTSKEDVAAIFARYGVKP